MDDGFPEVRNMISALISRSVSAEEQGMQVCGDREISMALFGLHRMGTQHDHYGFAAGSTSTSLGAPRVTVELKRAVVYLTSLLKHYTGPFEAKRLGFCLIGLTGIPNDLPEAKELVEALVEKANSAVGPITGQELSMCLHGLINLRPDRRSNRRLMLALIPLMRRCESMKSIDISSAMIGLQSMRISEDRDPEMALEGDATARSDLQTFFSAFAELIVRLDAKFETVHHAARGIYGLQSVISDPMLSKDMKDLLPRMLSSVTFGGKDGLDALVDSRDVAMLIYSLRSTTSQSDSSRRVFVAIAELMNRILKADDDSIAQGAAPILSAVRLSVSYENRVLSSTV
jgi:hypothetical protein